MPDATGTLTKVELESVLNYLYRRAEEALENNSREELRSALSEVSDITHPESILTVNVTDDTVTYEFPGDDDDDLDLDGDGEDDDDD